MPQVIKRLLWVGLLVLGLQGAWAFSLGGPIGNNPNPITAAGVQGDAWQLPVIGYGLPGDVNAPKNLGEEYRRNVPLMYYACDANFLGYFGSNGVSAVDGAFAILNNVFTNNPTGMINGLDGYSPDLSEFPLESRHLNYQAQALGFFDLKSWTLGVMMEQLGLADPVRYNWTLHDRLHSSLPGIPPCPAGMEYLVVQRNFDFISSPLNQLQYSPYVNDTLYSYLIEEFCTGPNPLAETIPSPVDPLADIYSPVASLMTVGLTYGHYYTGLTRDDVAGLRYLLTANNINFENGPAGSVLLNTSSGGGPGGLGPPFLLYTSNYTAFAQAALTNDPVTLATLFPGLVVSSFSSSFVVVATPNIVAYFTNNFVLGNPPVLVVKTNGFTYNGVANYADTFANLIIITNDYHANTSAQLVTVQVSQGGVLGNPLVTNTTTRSITLTNVPSGDYYIDTNYACGPTVILATILTNVVATTNLIYAASNSAGYFTSQSLVTYSTNHVFIAQSPVCTTATTTGGVANATGLYQGIEKIQFINAPFDSLIGQTFQPITNTFTTTFIIGSKMVTNKFQRVVTTPDFIFSAADIAAGPNNPSPPNPYVSALDRSVNFDQANALPGLAGPGLITPSSTIIFDKVGPVYYNYTGLMDGTPYFNENPGNDGSDLYYFFYFTWASFDGTTNDPVVYPNETSIENLENQILVQLSITPTSDVNYTNNPPSLTYDPNMTISVTGGAFVPPFTWSATGLPAGLTVTTTNSVGMLSGSPAQSGTFDFTLKLTDSIARSVQWTFSITTP
jgi:hypothetical protein